MKAVHWTVPFASLKGVQYRVDIYADGECATPIELMGGASPFTTDEDNDIKDPVTAGVIKSTGHLNVVDCGYDGIEQGELMETLMPADNIDRPVRLVEVKSATGESVNRVVWQGFLSCEAYSQDYTARAQELTLNVNSVLAAMESVQMPEDKAGFMTIGTLINDILLYMHENGGEVSEYYLPINSIGIINKYIDTTVLFEQKEQDNENSVTYTVSGLSMKEVLGRICTYMGWTLRENGDKLYFTDADNTHGMRRYYFIGEVKPSGEVVNKYIVEPNTSYRTIVDQMSAQEWRGTGHEIELRQGAKSVEVVAKVESENNGLEMQTMFTGNVTRKHDYLYTYQDASPYTIIRYGLQMYAFDGSKADSRVEFGHTSAIVNILAQDGSTFSSYIKNSTLANVLSHMAIVGTAGDVDSSYLVSTINSATNVRYHAGAFYAKCSWWKKKESVVSMKKTVTYDPEDTTMVGVEGQDEICTYPEPEDGIYCVFFPRAYGNKSANCFDPSKSKPILTIKSNDTQVFLSGYLNLTSSYKVVYHNTGFEDNETNGLKFSGQPNTSPWSVGATLQLGDRYWNGTAWQNTECRFRLEFEGGNCKSNWDKDTMLPPTKGLLIPVSEGINRGKMKLSIWPDASTFSGNSSASVLEMFFTSLNVEHVYPIDVTTNDRNENHYYQDIEDINAGDEVSVNTDIASYMNNKPSPSIIMNSETEPMTTLTYADGTSERPEKHLLSRLAAYYGAVRRKITLEIERPNGVMPMVKVTGFDEKTYLPLSESRDWRTDTSKVTCFETGNSEQLTENNE